MGKGDNISVVGADEWDGSGWRKVDGLEAVVDKLKEQLSRDRHYALVLNSLFSDVDVYDNSILFNLVFELLGRLYDLPSDFEDGVYGL